MKRALRVLISVAPEIIAVACLISLVWWSIGTSISTQSADAVEAAARDTTNLAHAFAENTEHIVSGADQVLHSLRAAYAREGNGLDLDEWVRRESVSDWLTTQVAIYGPDGESISSTASSQNLNVADRDYFLVQRDSVFDDLYVSAPIFGRRSGRWTIQVTRKLMTPTGEFNGIAVVSVDCYRLSGFYDQLKLQQGFIELIGTDGIIRARGPFKEGEIGSRSAMDRVLQSSDGTFRAPLGRDTLTISYRHLATYPLIVLIAYNDKAVLAGHRGSESVMVLSGALATLFLVVIGGIWIRQRKRSIRSQRALTLTLSSMSQGLLMVDAQKRVRVINQRALELLGLPASLLELFTKPRRGATPAAERMLLTAIDRLEAIRDRGGELALPVLELNQSPMANGGSVKTITDVTARTIADRRIRHMALHDHLTGLANRVLFAEEADHLLANAAEERFEVLFLDLDGFKKVNDTLGHEVGDGLLREVADRLTRAVRAGDLVARTGGDEFAILTRIVPDQADADTVAQRIHATLAAPFAIAGQQLCVGVSIGIAQFPTDGAARIELLRNADIALYVAKSDRTQPIQRFHPAMTDNARLKLETEQDLRAAIGTDQLFLEFQPQFRTSSLTVVGLEALVRWKHPTRGRLGPDVFIPVAEESGLIIALGRHVLEQACRAALCWPDHVRIAVNLSPVQFRDPHLVRMIEAVLAITGLPATRLELEVTEGVLIADEKQALATLNALRAIGVTFALDDFGTGYASLSYLRKFPFEQIKLDRSFVQAQVLEERSRHILRAILSLSRNLHLSVVAEGVETRTQLHLLRQQGCHAIQGFLVGRPMSRGDAEGMFTPMGAQPHPMALSEV